MNITYIGGPTAAFEYGGLRFVTDPTFDPAGSEYSYGGVTLSKTMGPAVEPASLGRIDAVLLSHEHHMDNLDQEGREALKMAPIVLTTVEGAQRLSKSAEGLAPWQEFDLSRPDGGRVKVTATPAQHGPVGADRGPVIGFVLESKEEAEGAVYVSGDTVWFEGVEETIWRFPKIRTAFLFMGAAKVSVVPSHLTLTAEEGVRFAQALPEAVIVPLHFEGWKHFTEGRETISEAFLKAGLEKRVHWL